MFVKKTQIERAPHQPVQVQIDQAKGALEIASQLNPDRLPEGVVEGHLNPGYLAEGRQSQATTKSKCGPGPGIVRIREGEGFAFAGAPVGQLKCVGSGCNHLALKDGIYPLPL